MSVLRTRAEINLEPRLAQFEVKNLCPIENPDDEYNLPLTSQNRVLVVQFPGRRDVPNYCGIQCGALHFRVVGSKHPENIGGWVCEHMGEVIE